MNNAMVGMATLASKMQAAVITLIKRGTHGNKLFYPLWYQKKVEAWRNGEIDWDGKPIGESAAVEAVEKLDSFKARRLLVHLRLDSLPGLFTFISLLGNDKPASSSPHL